MIKDRQQAGISCMDCEFSQLCLAKQFDNDEKKRMDRFIHKVKILNKGEHVYRDNDPVDYIYAVHSGTLKDYYVDEHGQEYINNFYFVGDLLALESIPQKRYSFSAVAITKTTLCMIPVVSLLTEMQNFPILLKRFLHISSYKMLNDKQIRPTTNAKHRVADFLINVLNRLEERNGKRASFQLPMSQVDMSFMIGMAYETVSRVLHHFEDENIISIDNRRITILNSKHLFSLGNNMKHFNQPIATLPM